MEKQAYFYLLGAQIAGQQALSVQTDALQKAASEANPFDKTAAEEIDHYATILGFRKLANDFSSQQQKMASSFGALQAFSRVQDLIHSGMPLHKIAEAVKLAMDEVAGEAVGPVPESPQEEEEAVAQMVEGAAAALEEASQGELPPEVIQEQAENIVAEALAAEG